MHSSFPHTTPFSLCFIIGLILPVVIGRYLPEYAPTSPASPLYLRATSDDPGDVQPQVDDLFRFLSTQKPSNGIQPRGENLADELKEHIK